MMWYSNGDAGWGGWSLMVISMLVFWGLLVWGAWSVLRLGSTRDDTSTRPSPEQVLAARFAAGEIDADAYRHGLDVLSGRDVAKTS